MKNTARPYLLSLLLLCACFVISIAVGSVFIAPQNIFSLFFSKITRAEIPQNWKAFSTILFELRLPRTVLMALTGAALSGSGAAYQGLFRNPLADPYIIGISSGAGLGAILAMSYRWPYTTLGLMAVPLAAFAGAILTVLVVYQLARVGKTIPTSNLILAGVAVSAFCSALTSFLLIISKNELHRAVAWLLGGASMSGWKAVLGVFPYITIGLGVLFFSGYRLNVLQFGDEQAQQLGLKVNRVRWTIIAAASLATAAAVSYTGTIGFIGLVVPHIIRLIWGGDYRRLIPLSIINGATLLLIADVLARIVLAPQEIPVGIITALGGAPFFLWLLRKTKQENYW